MEIRPLGTVGSYPKGNLNCSSFLIEQEDKKLLLDCGPGSSRLLDMYKDLRNLTVVISHYHPDHYSDLFAIFNGSYIAHKLGYLEEKVKIYCPYGSANDMFYRSSNFEKIMAEENLDGFFLYKNSHPRYIQSDFYGAWTELQESPFKISFYKTNHGGNAHAIKVEGQDGETLVYSGDTAYDENLISFAKGADAFLCEATYLRDHNRGSDRHLYAYEAGKMAKLANVKDLYLFHTHPELPKEDYVKEAKEYFERTHKIEEGKVFKITRNGE